MVFHCERVCATRNMARFYRVELCRTLFGDWVLVRIWGRIGSIGHRREDRFDTTAAREVLGIDFRDARDAVVASGQRLVELGRV